MRDHRYFVYMLASGMQGTIYIGVTNEAIAREKQLKPWRRDWKRSLIEQENPGWLDLYPALAGVGPGSARPSGPLGRDDIWELHHP